MVTGELDGVFKLLTTAELVIAAGALFNRLIIAALLLVLLACVIPMIIQKIYNVNSIVWHVNTEHDFLFI